MMVTRLSLSRKAESQKSAATHTGSPIGTAGATGFGLAAFFFFFDSGTLRLLSDAFATSDFSVSVRSLW
jgi:hypothetical protein